MNTSFLTLLKIIQTAPSERKAIRYKRKVKYEISLDRLNELIEKYCFDLDEDCTIKTIVVTSEDLEDLLFLFRCHCRIWIELDGLSLRIFQYFPQQFKIIKTVNKDNHWFTPKTFEVGQILYFSNNPYASCNWLNGIPLAESLKPIEGSDHIPTTQINYDYIRITED